MLVFSGLTVIEPFSAVSSVDSLDEFEPLLPPHEASNAVQHSALSMMLKGFLNIIILIKEFVN